MARGDAVVEVREAAGSSQYRDEESSDGAASSPGRSVPSEDFDSDTPMTRPPWYRRASNRVPGRAKRYWRATVNWVKGPVPPRRFTITPLLPTIQHAPLKLVDKIAPKQGHKVLLLMFFCALWITTFGLVQWKSNVAAEIPGYGSPTRLSCTSTFWNDGNGCGLNGDSCRPFEGSSMPFRCPANCASVQVLNPHAVGDQEVVYQSLLVGGPSNNQTGYEDVIENNAVYRGDSFICAAAIHSGFISNAAGGCGVTLSTGQQSSFPSSTANGLTSVPFNTYFPLSFGFQSGTRTECKDLRWPALIVSVVFSTILSLFVKDATVFFWTVFIGLFTTVAMATDPPFVGTFYSVFSTAVGRFLPAAFTIGIMYRFFIKRSLNGLTAQIEKTILWLGPAWVGALSNYTFDGIPIQRLTPHDIKAQPGALTALIIIVLVLVAIAVGQIWAFRGEGRMPRYLGLYGLFVLGLLIFLALPGVNLRIHHYILALLFIPGTSFQNRPSLVYQGLLVGLFVNGIARWNFDSIIQTPAQLFGGAQIQSLLPQITIMAVGVSRIVFNLGPLPIIDPNLGYRYNGMSILVNDVERFHGYYDEAQYWTANNASTGNYTWIWTRQEQDSSVTADNATLTEYFRFAYMSDSSTVDYTQAGKWTSDGKWTQMRPGPSKRRRARRWLGRWKTS